VVVSPAVVGVAAGDAANAVTPPPKAPPDIYGRCFDARAFKPLARLRPGVVMASQDLGSFILYATPHKVLIAPYHRLWPQILAVHRAFNAPPSQAEAKVRRLAPDYIVDCPGYPTQTDSGSFAAKLRENWSPNWLERVSLKGAVLQIYRLRPAGSGPISVPAGA